MDEKRLVSVVNHERHRALAAAKTGHQITALDDSQFGARPRKTQACGRMPAKGHLAEISRKKYGPRANESSISIKKILDALPDSIRPIVMKSDAKQAYKRLVAQRWPGLKYEVHVRKPDKIKELLFLNYEKKRFDPMFALNQRCAKLRDDIKRLARKNWCTTKKPENLSKHLMIYACYNNQIPIM